MSKIIIAQNKCKGCELCILACPKKNIRLSQKMNKKGFHYVEIIDPDKCNACGLCFQVCPDVAIEIWK
ncbi:MAG: 4Fe-4S binding protein [bacterium]|nr:4Fe-4S binding protein [bacterium]MDD5756744.1 4Fe-4S binding protein [bacterium]